MNWNKQDTAFEPNGEPEWMQSHAALPVAHRISGDQYRVYFASRNQDNKSQIGYVRIDITDPTTVLAVSEEPVVELGDRGTFDDSGVFPSAVVEVDGRIYLYYVGWMQGQTVPFYGMIGLAISEDGGETFHKHSRAPLVPRSPVDPYMTLSMDVHRTAAGWRMWYTSTTDCIITESGDTVPNYHIKYAESSDGIEWERDGTVCIDYASPAETRIARPRVCCWGDTYYMWYCYADANEGYEIGVAESPDGIEWERTDGRAGIEPSETGWDSEMLAYPYVVDHEDDTYLFYSGNGYGERGFGVAVLEERP